MATELTISGAHPVGEPATGRPAPIGEPVALDSLAGRIEVQWAPDETVTAPGQLPFFIDFLKQSDLFEPFVAEAPLRYAGPNAPQVRDVLGTLLLAVTNGAMPYSHVNAVRHDGVNPGLLDICRVCSDDSVLRAVGRMPKEAAEKWLRHHLSQGVRPLLQEPWVLDIDTTVKPVYGHQEGAEIGYNPLRKGRPSMAIQTYQMGVTRLLLEVDVEAGNRNHSKYGLPGLGRLLDELREEERPQLVRGEAGLYEYSVLVTSLQYEARTMAQLYRDRRAMENAVDEMKNQWGWGGFVTQDLKRTRIMARMNVLFYNWWSLFVRLISPQARREARPRRPTMLAGVGA